jgi:hypothetical protein
MNQEIIVILFVLFGFYGPFMTTALCHHVNPVFPFRYNAWLAAYQFPYGLAHSITGSSH